MSSSGGAEGGDDLALGETGTHSVEGRVVIVTGSGQGIGRGMAVHLAKHGARVTVAEWKPHRAERTAGEITELGGEALAVPTDVQDRGSIAAMVDRTVETWGRVDGLINNAHTFTGYARVEDITDEDLDTNYTSCVKGSLWAMQAVYPHMKAAGWGRIVNFVSAAGITGMPTYGAYNASKEAIRAITRTAAREWGRDGIVVNAIAPGAASKRGKESQLRQTDAYKEFLKTHPIGRQGDPEEDVGPVSLFLCSDACRFVTGMTFMVDGGAFVHA